MDEVVISVRGEAARPVPPDAAALRAAIAVHAAGHEAAVTAAAAEQERLGAALTRLGGVPDTADARYAPLTWSTDSLRVAEHVTWTERGEHRDGYDATAEVTVHVRHLDLLAECVTALTVSRQVKLRWVSRRRSARVSTLGSQPPSRR